MYGFELDHKESWVPKNWCFWTMVLENTLESPLDCKEIQPVNPKGNQSWIFIGRTDAQTKAPIHWPPDAENWLIGKDPDAGKDWRREQKGMTEDEMVGWHHWFNGHEFEQAPGVGEQQGSLACCCPWGSKESDTTEQLNWLTAHKDVDPNQVDLKVDNADSCWPHHQPIRRVSRGWSHLLWTISIKLVTIFPKWGHLKGMSPLCHPLPVNAIKLSFSTSPKTLSLRFDSARVHREAELSIT